MIVLRCTECNSTDLKMGGEFVKCKTCGTKYPLDSLRKLLSTVDAGADKAGASHGSAGGAPKARPATDPKDFRIRMGELSGYHGGSREVVIPSGIDTIRPFVFDDDPITSVVIPEGVTTIREGAFRNCKLLESVQLPDSLVELESGVFEGCMKLRSIVLPANLAKVSYRDTVFRHNVFKGCTALESVVFKPGTTAVPPRILVGCTALRSVTLPDGLESIGEHAFGGCSSLESIRIPDSVTEIGKGAFSGCTSLTDVQDISGRWLGAFKGTPYHAAKVAAQARERARQTMIRAEAWRSQGVCQHCGSAFKGMFSKTCGKCGRPKDY